MKRFHRYVEEMDMAQQQDKPRQGLADPDPGTPRDDHKPRAQDLDLAKQAIQIAMTASSKYHRKVYKFLRELSLKLPQLGNLVDQMNTPEGYNDHAPLGKGDKQPDVLSPNSADGSPAFYQK